MMLDRDPLECAIARVNERASGRTRYEGQTPFDDELLVAEIERLRSELRAARQAIVALRLERALAAYDAAANGDQLAGVSVAARANPSSTIE